MDHQHIYHHGIPGFLRECMETSLIQRLKSVGMNCGCEYTAFPRFADMDSYSRYDHSIGVALIVWHFTHDRKQAIAGLPSTSYNRAIYCKPCLSVGAV